MACNVSLLRGARRQFAEITKETGASPRRGTAPADPGGSGLNYAPPRRLDTRLVSARAGPSSEMVASASFYLHHRSVVSATPPDRYGTSAQRETRRAGFSPNLPFRWPTLMSTQYLGAEAQ